MIKKNLPMMILTSIIILLPIAVGLILWNQLPEQVATHWNIEGVPDGYSSKAMAVFLFPFILLAVHWLCVAVTGADPKNKDIQGKVLTLTLWICPMLSLLLGTITYVQALGHTVDINVFLPLFLGALFVFIGNYLPKCKQNYTIGIKTPWALNDEENWNKTHRFAGIIWVVGGALIMALSFLGSHWIVLIALAPMALAPVIYSYVLYRKKRIQ